MVLTVDGGDRACGELLLVLAAKIRTLPADSFVRLIATDPAATIDLPAWCHLTGHLFVRAGRETDDRPHYDVQISRTSRQTQAASPWRLAEQAPPPPKTPSTPSPDRKDQPS
ncbi:MAG: sulfurtransferase TusA family protein [Nocardioidaceae bacterium]|nr:sulfurtransferase TusA family protein [Nocardioidaceae bacterium]